MTRRHEKLTLFFCDHYHFPLPSGHKFPLAKYRKLREELAKDGTFRMMAADLAPEGDIRRVHSTHYVRGFLEGSVEAQVMRRIGFPWSQELVSRTLASVGGTLQATSEALRSGLGGTLAGGTHHAYRGEGSGFCVFNDIAIAAEWARAHAQLERIAVIDLDVHQGDGTASIFEGDRNTFTLSLHGERNFPFRKQTSVLDIPLPDGAGDDAYLALLQPALERVHEFRPELLFFQAGVDALSSDRLGRLALTKQGLAQRDSLVFQFARELSVPLVMTLGGGYSEPIDLTVEAHAQSFRLAASFYLELPLTAQPNSCPEP